MTAGSLIDQWAAAWTSHDPAAVAALFAADGVYEDVAFGAINQGNEAVRVFAQGFFEFSPDLTVELITQAIAGAQGYAEWIFSGTQAVEYLGKPANGKQWTLRGVSAFEIVDDKLTRCSDYWDVTTMANQLG